MLWGIAVAAAGGSFSVLGCYYNLIILCVLKPLTVIRRVRTTAVVQPQCMHVCLRGRWWIGEKWDCARSLIKKCIKNESERPLLKAIQKYRQQWEEKEHLSVVHKQLTAKNAGIIELRSTQIKELD